MHIFRIVGRAYFTQNKTKGLLFKYFHFQISYFTYNISIKSWAKEARNYFAGLSVEIH